MKSILALGILLIGNITLAGDLTCIGHTTLNQKVAAIFDTNEQRAQVLFFNTKQNLWIPEQSTDKRDVVYECSSPRTSQSSKSEKTLLKDCSLLNDEGFRIKLNIDRKSNKYQVTLSTSQMGLETIVAELNNCTRENEAY